MKSVNEQCFRRIAGGLGTPRVIGGEYAMNHVKEPLVVNSHILFQYKGATGGGQ